MVRTSISFDKESAENPFDPVRGAEHVTTRNTRMSTTWTADVEDFGPVEPTWVTQREARQPASRRFKGGQGSGDPLMHQRRQMTTARARLPPSRPSAVAELAAHAIEEQAAEGVASIEVGFDVKLPGRCARDPGEHGRIHGACG